VTKEEAKPKRDYLGASILGDYCERAVQYQAAGAVPEKPIDARMYRIFERGHHAEDMAIDWLRAAGFMLITIDPNTGEQFEFSIMGGQVKGHSDGIIPMWRGQDESPIPLPAVWECKCLGSKGWKAAVKDKLRESHPKYFNQGQLYAGEFGVKQILFTIINADTMEMHHEIVAYDHAVHDNMISRAQRILLAIKAQELLPRGFDDPTVWQCKWCRYGARCWA